MSRRYGRNQKRRAREEIAQLRESVEMANGLARHIAEKKDLLQAEIDRAKSLLPFGTVLFDPPTIRIEGKPRKGVRAPMSPPMMCTPADQNTFPTFEMNIVELDVLLTDVVLERMTDRIHFIVEFGNDERCYAIDRRCFRGVSNPAMVTHIRRISDALARDLLSKIGGALV